jgi:BASS family bile acid:Na+ symporter
MPIDGPFPADLISILAAVTLFVLMVHVGLGVALSELRGLRAQGRLLGRALLCVLVVMPLIALLSAQLFALPREAAIGVALMAISPGAPVALRRSIDAGANRTFAPALQVLIVVAAVVSMPLWVATLNHAYAGNAAIAPDVLARQVLVAQVLPLAVGVVLRLVGPSLADWLDRRLGRVAAVLVVALTLVVLVNVWSPVIAAGLRVACAIAFITAATLAAGHAMGGPDPAARPVVAICSAGRNPGLALVVATANGATPPIVATVLAYLVVSGLIILGYVIWRRLRKREAAIAAR